ncbi:hypothetical protein C805_00099 [Eubacterium sp. 14-2]|uniref:hypothetical protein n=1 Tax=Eubacterium sp. 14-2 TaxID=1235790 RepID=UPI00034009CC|nr:hypothetical protein [Eubacterium sp. 14-2]EOT28578.1 hypothetical protein C805_00099 [Eubacterium sp. 14-2]
MKKAEIKKIMKRAWEIKREDSRNIFSLCLKMAWAEFKSPAKKKGRRKMNVQNIKKGFYTDGNRIFSCYWGKTVIWTPVREESDCFLKSGNEMARFHEDLDVSKVKPGMEFCQGQIKVLDKNTIEILKISPVNPVYNKKGCCVSHEGYTEQRVTVTA